MPFVERLKSFLELQLEGWGPDELVSVGAELGVAACFVAPLIVLGALGRWVIRKKSLCQPGSVAPAEIHKRGRALSAVKHRS